MLASNEFNDVKMNPLASELTETMLSQQVNHHAYYLAAHILTSSTNPPYFYLFI